MKLLAIALLVVGLTACGSGNSGTTTQTASAATQAPASAGVPIYPGATAKPVPAGLASQTMCGHKMSIASYETKDSAKTVAAWYGAQLPGSTTADVVDGDGGGGAASVSTMAITDANGAHSVILTQMTFSSAAFARAGKSIGMDKTGIGIETYDPPMGPDYASLTAAAYHGDAAARAKLQSMCPSASQDG